MIAAVRRALDTFAETRVRSVDEAAGRLRIALLTPETGVEQCSFVASVHDDGQLRSVLIGGLDRYRTERRRRWRVVPVGPIQVAGIDAYRHLLEAIAQELTAAEPGTLVAITSPAVSALESCRR